MTREEAIKHLEDMKKGLFLWDMTELIDLCISALSENKGERDRMTEQSTPKMTHDEMIDVLKGLVFGTFDRTTAKEREALDMAISALENKGDLISRQAVLNGIAEWIADGYADSVADCSHISSLVSHLPSVENKGEWIEISDGDYECSECHKTRSSLISGEFNFCPNCGADMREPKGKKGET